MNKHCIPCQNKWEKTLRKYFCFLLQRGKDEPKVEYNFSDTAKYAMWVPPEDQSGDGKTSLNKKLGY